MVCGAVRVGSSELMACPLPREGLRDLLVFQKVRVRMRVRVGCDCGYREFFVVTLVKSG